MGEARNNETGGYKGPKGAAREIVKYMREEQKNSVAKMFKTSKKFWIIKNFKFEFE